MTHAHTSTGAEALENQLRRENARLSEVAAKAQSNLREQAELHEQLAQEAHSSKLKMTNEADEKELAMRRLRGELEQERRAAELARQLESEARARLERERTELKVCHWVVPYLEGVIGS